jgi:hypothetical protein
MEQYGFCLAGNPADRIAFPQRLHGAQHHHWMSHTAVKQAAGAVLQQLQQLQQSAGSAGTPGAQAPVQHDNQPVNVAEQINHLQDIPSSQSRISAHLLGGDAAAERRVNVAVTSIISAAGWKNLKQYQQVNPAQTCATAGLLQQWLQEQLSNQQSTIEEDIVQLLELAVENAEDGRGTRRQKLNAALQYRMENKLIMGTAVHVLNHVMNSDHT